MAKNNKTVKRMFRAALAMNQAIFPYDYKSVSLTNMGGRATFIGEPSKELITAVNVMAELAYKTL